jgi:DNA repair protein RecO
MHHIHHTDGIILGSNDFSETGKYFSIFTRDLGMIYASASGVRKLSSKLRFVLQDFAYVKVDLVQGRNLWRVTSASKTNVFQNICKNSETFRVFYNIANLLKRLLAGVEKNELLFSDLINGLLILEKFATDEPAPSNETLCNLEVVIVLRILNNLGYIGGDQFLQDLIKSPFEENLVFEVAKSKSQVLAQINKALKETHL